MTRGKASSNPRLVKIHRSYSVEEIARLFGIHKNTRRAEGGRRLDGALPRA
jgi:hypothetical protein